MQKGAQQMLQAGIAYMQEPPSPGYRPLETEDEAEPGEEGEGGEDRWKFMAADLDVFFTRAYDYYNERGYHCILVGESLSMLLLGFVNYVTMVLLLYVDWHGLFSCREHDGCHDITAFIRGETSVQTGALTELLSFIFVLGTWASWIVIALKSVRKVKDAREMRQYYHTELQISETDLLSKDWSDIVDEIVRKQASLTHRRHDAHDIANRIMRHDNYFIAMINYGEEGHPLLPLGLPPITVPSPLPQMFVPRSLRHKVTLPDTVDLPTPPDYLSMTLYYSLRWALLQDMFDTSFRVREQFLGTEGVDKLQKRFRTAGGMVLLMSPFLVMGLVMYLVLKHAEKILRQPSYVTERRWTDLGKWKFRWFNEMSHVFDRRKEVSYVHADRYVEQFNSEVLSILARFLTFVCGSLAGLLLVVCSINNSLMTTEYNDRDLWWYLGVFGSVLAVTRSVGAQPPVDVDPDKCLEQLNKLGFVASKQWEETPKSPEVVAEFKALYSPRFANVLQEFLAIIFTPMMLWTVYPKNADRILTFIRDNTEHSDSIGDVCGFATFNFDKYGDRDYGVHRSELTIRSKRKAHGGKMEKSFVSFKASNPAWDSEALEGVDAFPQSIGDVLTASMASVDVEAGRPMPQPEPEPESRPVTPTRAGGARGVGGTPAGVRSLASSTSMHMGMAERQVEQGGALSDSQMAMALASDLYLSRLGGGMEALEREHEQSLREQGEGGVGIDAGETWGMGSEPRGMRRSGSVEMMDGGDLEGGAGGARPRPPPPSRDDDPV